MSNLIVDTIYRTLLYSLWQGAIAAILAGIIVLCTKKTSPALRYNLLLADLLLYAACTAATFLILITHPASSTAQQTIAYHISNNAIPQYHSFPSTITATIDKASFFLNRNARLIVIAWLLVIGIKTLRLSFGLARISALRKRQVSPAGNFWNERLNQLSMQLGIQKCVCLLQSGLVKIPLTIGYLKPIILFPAGLLTSLSPGQLEAILLHELAHIRRNDYLVNILQSLVEMIFFFNPAVWWLSSLIRTERENCCDDLVIRNGNNRLNYLNALISFEEVQGTLPQYASGLTGPHRSLLNRAKRIVSNRNKTLHTMEKMILTSALLVTGLFTIAFNRMPETNTLKAQTAVTKNKVESALKMPSAFLFQYDTIPGNAATPGSQTGKTKDTAEVSLQARKAAEEAVEKMNTGILNTHGKEIEVQIAEAKEKAEKAMLFSKDVQDRNRKLQAEEIEKAMQSTKDLRDRNMKVQAEEIEKAMQSTKDLRNRNMKLLAEEIEKAMQSSKDLRDRNMKVQAEEIEKAMQSSKDLRNRNMNFQEEALKGQMDQMKDQLEKAKDLAELSQLYSANILAATDKLRQKGLLEPDEDLRRQMDDMRKEIKKATLNSGDFQKINADAMKADLKVQMEEVKHQMEKNSLQHMEKAKELAEQANTLAKEMQDIKEKIRIDALKAQKDAVEDKSKEKKN